MSNIIPPMVPSSPPPIEDAVEEDEDEFGDFAIADDSSNNVAGDLACWMLQLPDS
jgi:hypothetical protein